MRRRRAILAALAFVVAALLLPATAGAEPPDYERYRRLPRIPKRVGILAFRNYALEARDLFRDEASQLAYDDTLEAVQRHIEQRLAQEDGIELVPARQLRDELTDHDAYRQGILLAREWFNLGVSHYRALRLDRALENLERAQKLYLEVFQDVVEPYAVAEVDLYRALSLSEKKMGELAHVALKRMFALNPWKNFTRGYFAAETEQAFVAALVDYQLSGRRDLPLLTEERGKRFLDENGLDALLFAYAERDAEGNAVLQIVVYEKKPGRVTYREPIELTGTELDIERVDRWISKALCCTEWPHPKRPAGPESHRWFLDVGFVESFALVRPTNDLFHDIGFATSLSYQLKKSLDLFGTVFITTTLPDPARDLMQSTTGVRLTLGAGFTFRHRRLRFYVHPGVQLAYLGERSWTHDPDCKFYFGFPTEERESGPINQVCAPSDINSLRTTFRAGLDLALGLDVFLSNELYLGLKTAATAYIFPFDETDLLNFPLHFQLSIGYAL